jgi:hypothetical protein
MTVLDFILKLREIAREQPRRVVAIDYEPTHDGLKLTFCFAEKVQP